MGKNPIKANMANKPIMPKKENMARIPSLASGESMPTRANTPIMPDIANMARVIPDMAIMTPLPRLKDIPGISNHFTLPLSQPWYDWDDYRRADSD
jgi:hypothetical protein